MDGFSYGSPYLDSLSEKYNYVEMIHETFDNVIVPGFKGRGFRKNGKTFYRQRDGLIEVCHVKFSRDNSRVHARFSLEIQIAIPSFYDLLGKKYDNKWDTTIFYVTPGSLIAWDSGLTNCSDLYYMLDLWGYSVSSSFQKELDRGSKRYLFLQKLENRYNRQTGEGFNEVVASDIENVIIKFFSTILSVEQLLNHIDNDKPSRCADEVMMYNVANLYHSNGEKEKAKEILRRILNGFLEDTIKEYINNRGIDL